MARRCGMPWRGRHELFKAVQKRQVSEVLDAAEYCNGRGAYRRDNEVFSRYLMVENRLSERVEPLCDAMRFFHCLCPEADEGRSSQVE